MTEQIDINKLFIPGKFIFDTSTFLLSDRSSNVASVAEDEIARSTLQLRLYQQKNEEEYQKSEKLHKEAVLKKYLAITHIYQDIPFVRPTTTVNPTFEILQEMVLKGIYKDFDEISSTLQIRKPEIKYKIDELYLSGGLSSQRAFFAYHGLLRFLKNNKHTYSFTPRYNQITDIGKASMYSGKNLFLSQTSKKIFFNIFFDKHYLSFLDAHHIQLYNDDDKSSSICLDLSEVINNNSIITANTLNSTLYIATKDDQSTITIFDFNDIESLKNFKFTKNLFNLQETIDKVCPTKGGFGVFTKAGESYRIDLKNMNISKSGFGLVYSFSPFSIEEDKFITGYCPDKNHIYLTEYNIIDGPYTQLIPAHFTETSAFYPITKITDRILQAATRRIIKLDKNEKTNDEQGFDASLTENSLDYITIITECLEKVILSTLPYELRVHCITALIRALVININVHSLQSVALDAYMVKRIQRILMNVPIVAPVYDSLFMFLKHVFSDVYTNSKFIRTVFGRFDGRRDLLEAEGPQSILIVNSSSSQGLDDISSCSFYCSQLRDFIIAVNSFGIDEPLVPFIKAYIETAIRISKSNHEIAQKMFDNLCDALLVIGDRPFISSEVITQIMPHFNYIIKTVYKSTSNIDLFDTTNYIEFNRRSFNKDIIIKRNHIFDLNTGISEKSNMKLCNTNGVVIPIISCQNYITQSIDQLNLRGLIFIYTIGVCVNSCLISTPISQIERENAFMLEHTGGSPITMDRESFSGQSSPKFVQRFNSAQIFNPIKFVEKIYKGAPFMNKIIDSVKPVIKRPSEEMKSATRKTFAALLIHTNAIRTAHTFSIKVEEDIRTKTDEEVPIKLRKLWRESQKVLIELSAAKQSTLVSGSLKHRYQDYIKEILLKADTLILQGPSDKPIEEATKEAIDFITSSLPISEVHTIVELKKTRFRIRELGVEMLKATLDGEFPQCIKDTILQPIATSNKEFLGGIMNLIINTSFAHGARLFDLESLYKAIETIKKIPGHVLAWSVVSAAYEYNMDEAIRFVGDLIKKHNECASTVSALHFNHYFNQVPEKISSYMDAKLVSLVINHGANISQILTRNGLSIEFMISEISRLAVLPITHPEKHKLSWYEVILEALINSPSHNKIRALIKTSIYSNDNNILGSLILITMFEDFKLDETEAKFIQDSVNQIIKNEDPVDGITSIANLILLDAFNYLCTDPENVALLNIEKENLFQIVSKLTRFNSDDILRNILFQVEAYPKIPEGKFFAVRAGSVEEGNILKSTSENSCLFLGSPIESAPEFSSIIFRINLRKDDAVQMGFMDANGVPIGYDNVISHVFSGETFTPVQYRNNPDIINFKVNLCSSPFKVAFPIVPYVITYNQELSLEPSITIIPEENKRTFDINMCKKRSINLGIPVGIGSTVYHRQSERYGIVRNVIKGFDSIQVTLYGGGKPPTDITVSSFECSRVEDSYVLLIQRYLLITHPDLPKEFHKISHRASLLYARDDLIQTCLRLGIIAPINTIIQIIETYPDKDLEDLLAPSIISNSQIIMDILDDRGLNPLTVQTLINILKPSLSNCIDIINSAKLRRDLAACIIEINKGECSFDDLVSINYSLFQPLSNFTFKCISELEREVRAYIREGKLKSILNRIPKEAIVIASIMAFSEYTHGIPRLPMLVLLESFKQKEDVKFFQELLQEANHVEKKLTSRIDDFVREMKLFGAYPDNPELEMVNNPKQRRMIKLRSAVALPSSMYNGRLPAFLQSDLEQRKTIEGLLHTENKCVLNFNRFEAIEYTNSKGNRGSTMLEQMINQVMHKLNKFQEAEIIFNFGLEGSIDQGGPRREAMTMIGNDITEFCYTKDGNNYFKPDTPDNVLIVTGMIIGFLFRKGDTYPFSFPENFWSTLVGGNSDEGCFQDEIDDIETSDDLQSDANDQPKSLGKFNELTISTGSFMSVESAFATSKKLNCINKFSEDIETTQQYNIVKEGFNIMIPESAAYLVESNVLKQLVCGVSGLDGPNVLKYIEGAENAPTFVEVIKSFTQEEVRKLLRFTTGSETVSPGVFAFKLNVYEIPKGVPEENTRLPMAHTCFRSLDIYNLSSYDIMSAKLRIAIECMLISDNNPEIGLVGHMI